MNTTRRSRKAGLAVVLAAVVAIAALSGPRVLGQAAAPGAKAAPAPGDYRIGPEDQLDIVADQNPGLTRSVRVRPDGKISLPLVNDIQAADLTPMQLRAAIANGLQPYFKPVPEISVIVTQVHPTRASVLGQVNTPGRVELSKGTTVLEALAMGGGFTTYAKTDAILIHRRDGSTVTFNYDRAVASRDFKENIVLLAGDIIIVR